MNDKVQMVFRPDPKDVAEVLRKTRAQVGQPFIVLPGDRNKVLKVFQTNGITFKARMKDLEMVLNERLLMDWAYSHCAGHEAAREAADTPEMKDLFQMAMEIAASDPVTTAKVNCAKEGRCAVCNESLFLPHADNCPVRQMRKPQSV